MSRHRRALVVLVAVVAALAPVVAPAPAGAARTVGGTPLDQILAAADRHKDCGLSRDRLAAFMIAPIFRESGAPPTQAPSPMTLSRWDNQAALYSHGNPATYPQAFWHPGISPWQWDDASLQGLSSFQRIDSAYIADFTAHYMVKRWCNSPDTGTLWAPWFACNGGACTAIYNEIYQGGRLVNVNRDLSVSRFGGMEARTCTNGTAATFTCWFVDPARAEGHTGWRVPGAGPAPITKPFYAFTVGGVEHRHWLRAHTGYNVDIRASLQLGLNSRTSLVWANGSSLCDITAGVGQCDTVPGGFTAQSVNVSGSYQALVGDFDGDGRSDVFWYAPGPAADHLWRGQANRSFASTPHPVNGAYTPLVGDFDRDGRDDIFWYAAGPAIDTIWFGRPGGFDAQVVSVNGRYAPVVGDFDGNRADDIFWYAPGPAADHLWLGTDRREFVSLHHPVSGTYLPVVGDFDGDRRDDILWYGPGAVRDSLWQGRPGGAFRNVSLSVNGVFRPLVGDYDGDGRDDILWYVPGPGKDFLWRGASGFSFRSDAVSVNGTYRPAVLDRNGDGRDDLLWYAPGWSADHVWTATAAGFSSAAFQWSGTSQHVLVGDYDGNRRQDVLWYGPGAAADRVWWAG